MLGTPNTPEQDEAPASASSSGAAAQVIHGKAQQQALAEAEKSLINVDSTEAEQQDKIFSSLLSAEGMAAMSAPDTPASSTSSAQDCALSSGLASSTSDSQPWSVAGSSHGLTDGAIATTSLAEIPLLLDMSSAPTRAALFGADEAAASIAGTTPTDLREATRLPDGLPPFVVASFGRKDPKDKYCGPPPAVPDRSDVLTGSSARVFAQDSITAVNPASKSGPPSSGLTSNNGLTSYAAGVTATSAELDASPSQGRQSQTTATANPRSRKLWTAEHDAKVVEMRERGCTQSVIAAALGRTPTAVKNRFQKLRLDGILPPVHRKPAASGSATTPTLPGSVGASLPSTARQQAQTPATLPAITPAAGTPIVSANESGARS